MPTPCPHCAADVSATLVAKTEVATTLAAKEAEILRLKPEAAKGALTDGLAARLAAAETLAARVPALETAAAAATQRAERMQALGTASPRLLDPQISAAVEAVYGLVIAAMPEAERPAFGAWLGDAAGAKAHPLLAALFTNAPAAPAPPAAAPAAPATAAAQSAPAAPPRPGLPPANTGAAPPAAPAQGPMSRPQIEAYFRSPEYRALPKDQQVTRYNELVAQAQAAKSNAVAV